MDVGAGGVAGGGDALGAGCCANAGAEVNAASSKGSAGSRDRSILFTMGSLELELPYFAAAPPGAASARFSRRLAIMPKPAAVKNIIKL